MPQRPRGTRDFAPDETAVRRRAAETLRDVFRRFGFREVQTPVFEELELFTEKSGEGIISELYNFKDKGDREMTLRPELTAPVMRMYFQDHAFDPKPLKWFYHGACYRYDRPQTGRYREFWQFGCEQIGAGTPLAYAELIAMGESCFDALGLKNRRTTVGHVAVLRELVDALGIQGDDRGAVMRLIDKRDDDGLRALLAQHKCPEDVVERLFAAMEARTVEAAKKVLEAHPALDELEAVFRYLSDLGCDGVELDLGIARGLDYYTGIVFETHCPVLEAQSQLLGGGGYDLSALFGAQSTPTMGFGLGFDRALVALEAEGITLDPEPGPQAYFGAMSDAARDVVVQKATWLRRHGAAVEVDLLGRKPGQVAKAADAVRARYLVIVGDRDLESGTVQAKRLTDGESFDVPLDGIEDFLLEHSAGVDLRDYN